MSEPIDWRALPWSRANVAVERRRERRERASERWAAGAAHREAVAAWQARLDRSIRQYETLVGVGAMSLTAEEIESRALAEVGPKPTRGPWRRE